ncbi:Os02g0583900 [Oryza sativa Japonica Group]|uniref:Os02g0583900 protein n=1 Tax=Oryza sativa subsp. japonica TaxID=39947 RepID=Q6EPU7_ORYSJ|nr:unknown protein [Oryza sativa Japonica Group]BAF09174.1 Os02g0583900 [Oryza sativa Japonica Group]|eukprot:NP_001047260.1 Os02g0583900 [Oryza sativa Japonica Group]
MSLFLFPARRRQPLSFPYQTRQPQDPANTTVSVGYSNAESGALLIGVPKFVSGFL